MFFLWSMKKKSIYPPKTCYKYIFYEQKFATMVFLIIDNIIHFFLSFVYVSKIKMHWKFAKYLNIKISKKKIGVQENFSKFLRRHSSAWQYGNTFVNGVTQTIFVYMLNHVSSRWLINHESNKKTNTLKLSRYLHGFSFRVK